SDLALGDHLRRGGRLRLRPPPRPRLDVGAEALARELRERLERLLLPLLDEAAQALLRLLVDQEGRRRLLDGLHDGVHVEEADERALHVRRAELDERVEDDRVDAAPVLVRAGLVGLPEDELRAAELDLVVVAEDRDGTPLAA